ncbi:MAG: GC-type dockerin domain-anchored protein [Planctomycetota bacterium]
MSHRTNIFVRAACLALCVGAPAPALAQQLVLEEHANVQMMVESVLHGVAMEATFGGVGPADGALDLFGTFDASFWSAQGNGVVGGGDMSLQYSGELLATPDGLESPANGSGQWAGDVWNSSIVGLWTLDDTGTELVALDYDEVADDGGALKPKWWVKALEAIAGGAIGSIGGVGVGTIEGAIAGVNLSNLIFSDTSATGDPPAGRPGADVTIEMSPPIDADQIVVVVAGDGRVEGHHRSGTTSVRFVGEWFVDPGTGGQVTGTITLESSGCIADFDGDGALTVFDFLAFQNAFASGDATADIDGDGALTIFDFLAFQNLFAAGC